MNMIAVIFIPNSRARKGGKVKGKYDVLEGKRWGMLPTGK